MRKTSLLSILLVLGLIVSLVGTVGLADPEKPQAVSPIDTLSGGQNAYMRFDQPSIVILRITGGSNIGLGSFDPRNDHDFGYTTSLKVISNTDWSLSTSEEVTNAPSDADKTFIKDHFVVSPDQDSGSRGVAEFGASYSWDKLSAENLTKMPQGDNYTVQITYTVSTN